tara:strand:+ start:570 stop:731 length:162 start_codon:yes stop_codon:yes gene_type:complete
MSNYPKPKLFKPSLEEQKEIASKLAGLFSSKVGVKLTDGTVIPGERDKLKKSN